MLNIAQNPKDSLYFLIIQIEKVQKGFKRYSDRRIIQLLEEKPSPNQITVNALIFALRDKLTLWQPADLVELYHNSGAQMVKREALFALKKFLNSEYQEIILSLYDIAEQEDPKNIIFSCRFYCDMQRPLDDSELRFIKGAYVG